MGYDVAKIKKEIAENKRSAVLSRAKLHQMRIKFPFNIEELKPLKNLKLKDILR